MTTTFNDYTLHPDILKSLDIMGFDHPTKVQAKAIPLLLDHKDLIIKSQTGSGKTAAFGIPICHHMHWDANKPQAMVITPTRELAVQVSEELFNIGRFKRIKVVSLYGKAPFHLQQKQLKQKTHIVVGTPGRIADHLAQGTLDVSDLRYLVIDEADEMFTMGFIDQIQTILDALPSSRVTTLLSATFPEHILRLCQRYLRNPDTIDVQDSVPVEERITQVMMESPTQNKLPLLQAILLAENPDSVIIFCNTQQMVEAIYEELSELTDALCRIHGGMEQKDRLKVMDDFRKGHYKILIATDVASRGIDIDTISLVINYDVPQNPQSYVHRIGRTARIGNQGKAITLIYKDDLMAMQVIQGALQRTIPVAVPYTHSEIELSRDAFMEKYEALPTLKVSKGERLNDDIMKLHIRGGKKTKMRAVDVVGGICSIEGVDATDIGIINILDLSTYVEILNGKGDLALAALQSIPIKGRVRVVTIANR
jgi:ATP-dependent RNA helicase DeaD